MNGRVWHCVLIVARDEVAAERTRAGSVLTALVRTIDRGVDAGVPDRQTDHGACAVANARSTPPPRSVAVRPCVSLDVFGRSMAAWRAIATVTTLMAKDIPELLELTGIEGRGDERSDHLVAPRPGSRGGRPGPAGWDGLRPGVVGQHCAPPP